MWGEPEKTSADAATKTDFNSLAPCGANRCLASSGLPFIPFQLTRPVWGEPRGVLRDVEILAISTHSPRVGRTSKSFSRWPRARAFQLTRPVWGEPRMLIKEPKEAANFNSLAPCGANQHCCAQIVITRRFQLTRPVWGEPIVCRSLGCTIQNFNSLAPCGANQVAFDFFL